MHTNVKRIGTFLLVLLVVLSVRSNALAQETVVAKVGTVEITIYELSRRFQKLLPLAGTFHGGVSKEKVAELREQAMADLIDKSYMVQYAMDKNLQVSQSEVDAVIDPIRKRFKSEDEFVKAVGPEGVDNFVFGAKKNLLSQKALKYAVEDRIVIDEKALISEFEKEKHRYKRPRQFEASHILIKVDPALTAEEKKVKKEFVESLYAKAMSGEDFYNLAYFNSEAKTKMVGGELPPFHLGQMQPEVEEAILKMKPGHISAPIRTFYGYEIILLKSDSPEKQLTYQDMREKLMQKEREVQREQLKSVWMEKLKAKYKVERY